MKIIILGGFLGSGKTTVLLKMAKKMIQNPGKGKTPVVIIENEIGDVSVDTKMLGGYQVREIFSGCICCSLAGDLTSNANEIAEKYDPDYLIIEATGVAHPDNVVNVMKDYAKADDLFCVVLVDAARWDELFEDMEVFMTNQLKGASSIVLNKCDLVSEDDANRIANQLADLNKTAKVLKVVATNEDNTWVDKVLEA